MEQSENPKSTVINNILMPWFWGGIVVGLCFMLTFGMVHETLKLLKVVVPIYFLGLSLFVLAFKKLLAIKHGKVKAQELILNSLPVVIIYKISWLFGGGAISYAVFGAIINALSGT